MTSSSANIHSKRVTAEVERSQRADVEAAQQLKMRERQRFFEEVFQHDVDVYLSSAHLSIRDYRPPIGSISSMEVNVDLLDQMELIDISDHDALDVFFSDEPVQNSVLSGQGHNNNNEEVSNGLYRHVLERLETRSRLSSASSVTDSRTSNANAPEVSVAEDEGIRSSTLKRREKVTSSVAPS